jgi:hypothetical protein
LVLVLVLMMLMMLMLMLLLLLKLLSSATAPPYLRCVVAEEVNLLFLAEISPVLCAETRLPIQPENTRPLLRSSSSSPPSPAAIAAGSSDAQDHVPAMAPPQTPTSTPPSPTRIPSLPENRRPGQQSTAAAAGAGARARARAAVARDTSSSPRSEFQTSPPGTG